MNSYTIFATYGLRALTDALYIRYNNVAILAGYLDGGSVFSSLILPSPVVDGLSYL